MATLDEEVRVRFAVRGAASGWLQRLVRHFGVTAYWRIGWEE